MNYFLLTLFTKKSIIVLTIDKIIAPINAEIIPFISNPDTKNAASENVNVFITIANNPKVTSVIGKEISLRIGLMNVFTRPTIIVAIIKVCKSTIFIPSTIFAVTKRARALPKNEIKYFMRLSL